MKAISYSLFGYNHKNKDCYDFKSYFRYFSINMRMRDVLWPEWRIYLAVDEETYNSPYKEFFDYHSIAGKIDLEIVPLQPLCLMMLYRMKPIFKLGEEGACFYDRVICRDVDSLSVYREYQAVQYWINNGRLVHAITDSVSHTIPMMGGLVGFKCKEFKERLNLSSFEEMLALSPGRKYDLKGSDQDFLNQVILPRVTDTITEHFILGMYQTGRGDCHHYIQETALPVSTDLKESNYLVNHCGQSGYAIEPVFRFFNKFLSPQMEIYYNHIEKLYKNIFYWQD